MSSYHGKYALNEPCLRCSKAPIQGMRAMQATLSALLALAAAVTASALQTAQARVTRFIVEERVPFAPGVEWGKAGAYERLSGTAYMEVDPADPLNAVIVNLNRAPRNARGLVEFSSPFMILKPVDMQRGNGKIWYGINNRGRRCIELGYRGAWPDPKKFGNCYPLDTSDVGENNILLQEGYTFVDAGWQGDGLPDPNALYPKFPIARQPDGSSIVGLLRLEYSTTRDTFTRPLISGWRPYEPADTDTAGSTLTVRNRVDAPRTPVASDRWAFGRCPGGQPTLVATTTDLCLFDGFEANKIYELIYPAKDPIVMGLAYAVTRDIGSFLRYETRDDEGNPNPLAVGSSTVGIRRAYSSGTSSTGMYQREFLYLGFNEDEANRKVFDGVTIYSAGTYRLFANVQFAHPHLYSRQDWHSDYTSNAAPPFTFAVTTDPLTGITDGILKRPATDPFVIQIDEETAFWQWKASLNVVDADGHPVPVPNNVRLYYLNGFGHVNAVGLLAPPQEMPNARHQTGRANSTSTAVTARALVRVMDDWVDHGIEPPESNYPGKEDLLTPETYRAVFPSIPKMQPPGIMNELDVLSFGPLFTAAGGVKTLLPPTHGSPYPLLVPAPRPDGDSVAGIDTIFTRAALGTNVGWNPWTAPRTPDLFSMIGSFVPFAKTKAERLANSDVRPSLQERYTDHDGFVQAVRQATRKLVQQRFMLPEDAEFFSQGAEKSDILKEATN